MEMETSKTDEHQTQTMLLLPPERKHKSHNNEGAETPEESHHHRNEEERVLHKAEKENPELLPHLAPIKDIHWQLVNPDST